MRYCAYCEYNDGCVYTSLPPQYKCTITGEFHLGDDPCSVDFAPVKHGRWIAMSDADGVYWACSECGEDIPRVSHYNPQFDLFPRLESIDKTNYCPNCGARMYTERKE